MPLSCWFLELSLRYSSRTAVDGTGELWRGGDGRYCWWGYS